MSRLNLMKCKSVVLLLFALCTGLAEAATPNAPYSFNGRLFPLTLEVEFMWLHDGAADGFKIYQAQGRAVNPRDFKLVEDVAFEKSYLYDSTGTTRDSSDSSSSVHGFGRLRLPGEGIYSFYVIAYNGDGESAASNVRVIEAFNDKPINVWFTTAPPLNAVRGEEYVYQANAEAEDGADVLYELVRGPQGMTVDRETGLITWKPGAVTQTAVMLRAYVNDHSEAHQSWVVTVRMCAEPAVITGKVTDENGNPVKDDGYILVYGGEGAGPRDTSGLGYQVRVVDGEYSIEVDAGKYKVQFNIAALSFLLV